jgi:predicted NUDIX family NTP pyrophosphohydrolase
MTTKFSAGLLLFRQIQDGVVEVYLAHPGGPFWAQKDNGSWSIPKGEYAEGDDPWEAALREFREEIGIPAPDGEKRELGELRQPSGKRITAYALEANFHVESVNSNLFEMEWPPKSGRIQKFPEIDRADWFTVDEGRRKLLKGQVKFLDELMSQLRTASDGVVIGEPQAK